MKHRLTIASVAFAGAAFALSVSQTGCSSIDLDNTGQMRAVYQFGEFKMLLNTTSPVAAQATQKVLQQFDLFQTKYLVNTYDASIAARNRADQIVTVDIAEVNSRQTLIRIRWGAGGDLARSRRLYEAIENALPTH